VQGLTEFLPVSSDGHLAVIGHVAGVHTPGIFVEVALHVATLGSILVVYGARFWRLAVGVVRRQPDALRYAGLLIIGMIPAGLVEARRASVEIAQVGGVPLLVGCLVAFLAGVFAIRFLVAMLRRGRFFAFAPYCFAIGLFTLAYALWHG